jgi:hypothetical protein
MHRDPSGGYFPSLVDFSGVRFFYYFYTGESLTTVLQNMLWSL